MWFAFKLVSLNHWIQQSLKFGFKNDVVICFQISIFEPLNTAMIVSISFRVELWFAFKLVSLNHWIQHLIINTIARRVVICFQISIFEPLNTAEEREVPNKLPLWFAFKLVSLNHWIQRLICDLKSRRVVICFQISIFEPLNTAQPHAKAVTS